ncbi:MAG: hypothetical protein ACRCXD_01590 [Luteolibacter sp.]
MNDRDVRRLERIERVETFLETHIADFTPGGIVATTLAEIKLIITALNKARVGQIRTPLTKQEIILALRERFKAIALTARSIHIKPPDFPEGDFRTPDEDSENVTTAHADHLLTLLRDGDEDTPEQLAAKAALRARFIEFEMSADFVTTLHTLRVSLDDANAGKFSDNQEGLESTAEIALLLNQANDAVTTLHGPIQNKYESQPDKIHAWKRASRIESDPQPPEDPEPPTP